MKILDTNIYLGSNQIFKIYKGDTIVYQKGSDQPNYFKINALTNTSVGFDWVARQLQYRINNGEWIAPDDDDSVSMNKDDVMEIVRTVGRENIITEDFGQFTFQTGSEVSLSGNIMSLLDDDFENFDDLTGWGGSYEGIFYGLFSNNNAVVDASDLILPANTLSEYCYNEMFKGCVSLTSAPELPAMTLDRFCYMDMFRGCSALTEMPELPAMNIPYMSYAGMFYQCTSLTAAKDLPATNLDYSCYSRMFAHCSNLTAAPDILPAMTLAEDCYMQMFYYCRSLTSAPELPAIDLVTECYVGMFDGCQSLSEIKCNAIYGINDDNLIGWVYGVANSGTFYKSDAATDWVTGINGIPTGWTVIPMPAGFIGLTMTSNGDSTVSFNTQQTDIQYKINDGDWTDYVSDTSLNLSDGDKLCWLRNGITTITNKVGQFSMTGSIAASGNCYSLITAEYKDFDDLTGWGGSNGIFYRLFYNCSALTSAPKLPANTLADQCYQSMFQKCSSLTTTPALPAENLAFRCYANMFGSCRSLINVNTLPATTLATGCYMEMFSFCTSLIVAPELNATTLVSSCYASMFSGCTLLNEVVCLATDNSAETCTNSWLSNVSETGDFYMDSIATWITGPNGIPENWTVHQI